MGKIKIEIEENLLEKLKETWKWTFKIEGSEKRTIGRKIRSAFLIDKKTPPNQMVEIAIKDYLKILEKLYQ